MAMVAFRPRSSLFSASKKPRESSRLQTASPRELSQLEISQFVDYFTASHYNNQPINHTYSFMVDTIARRKVPLQRESEVAEILKHLERDLAEPVCRYFGLQYSFIGEFHPQNKRAGMTYTRNETFGKSGIIKVIRIRVRHKETPESKLFSLGTLYAVLLHELAHLKCMNHSEKFAFFLRDIYAFANKSLKLFMKPESCHLELPSPWSWEREVFRTKGDLDDSKLSKLFSLGRADSEKCCADENPAENSRD
jgi:WLM domain